MQLTILHSMLSTQEEFDDNQLRETSERLNDLFTRQFLTHVALCAFSFKPWVQDWTYWVGLGFDIFACLFEFFELCVKNFHPHELSTHFGVRQYIQSWQIYTYYYLFLVWITGGQ